MTIWWKGYYIGMITTCAVVVSWCLMYEWMLRAGMAVACK
jgi:hypothetical protein